MRLKNEITEKKTIVGIFRLIFRRNEQNRLFFKHSSTGGKFSIDTLTNRIKLLVTQKRQFKSGNGTRINSLICNSWPIKNSKQGPKNITYHSIFFSEFKSFHCQCDGIMEKIKTTWRKNKISNMEMNHKGRPFFQSSDYQKSDSRTKLEDILSSLYSTGVKCLIEHLVEKITPVIRGEDKFEFR